MTIVIQETLRGLLYTPFYLALSLEAYKDEGLDVRFTSSPRPADAADGLLAGTVDVTWGGPFRVNVTYEKNPNCDLVCFCEVITRDPFFLVGRTPCPDFRLSTLKDLRLAIVSEVPTPWLCLQEDLREVGIDPDGMKWTPDLTMAESSALLRAGKLDVVQLFEPFVESLCSEGTAHVWYAAADRGPTSYTTLYATRSFLKNRTDEARSLVRAIYRVQRWLHGAQPNDIARAVQSYFPNEPETLLAAAIDRYKRAGIWGENPRLPRSGYEQLRRSLVSGGYVREGVAYERAVDNSFAEQVMSENIPMPTFEARKA